MKMDTTPEQTAKLIELGFDKPKSIGGYEPTYVVEYEGVEVSNVIIGENKRYPIYAYSIGELLSILPSTVREVYDLHIESSLTKWYVAYYWIGNGGEYYIKYEFSACELIDTLYMMILKLKEKGVI